MAKKKKDPERSLENCIPTYTTSQVDNKEVDVGRNTSDEVRAIREEVMTKIIPKKGQMCLLNDIVKYYNEGKSDPPLHTRLRNIFHKPHLGVKIVLKDGRLWVERTK